MDPNVPSGGQPPGWVPPPDPTAPQAPPPGPSPSGTWAPPQPGAYPPAYPPPGYQAAPYGPGGYPPGGGWVPPAPGKPKRFGWGAVIAGFLIGGFLSFVITFGGIVAIGLTLGSPDSIEGTHPAAGEGADTVVVGDCLSEGMGFASVVDQSDVVDCMEAHDAEVAAVFEIPGGRERPGGDDLDTFVDDACKLAFEGYVGSDPITSQYGYGVIVPSDDAWRKGDKTAYCLINTVNLPAGEGSVKDSGD